VHVPSVVIAASILQLSLAATFLIVPAVGYRRGAKAQRAAEVDVAAQGFPAGILAENNVRFEERPIDVVLPLAIAACLGVLAALNLAGVSFARTGSFVFQPVLLVGGGLVTARQVFAVRYVESAFRKSGDSTLQRVDVRSFVTAALDEFPGWFQLLITTRFILVTVGSLVVIILLSTAPAQGYFS